MLRSFNSPLVGMRFRPPAEDIVNNLPGGAVLRLVLQPENPHDADAICVLLYGFSAVDGAVHQALFKTLYGNYEIQAPHKLEMFTDPIQLGFIANSDKTGGKHASSIGAFMRMDGLEQVEGTLSFSADAKPQVLVQWDNDFLDKIPDEFKQSISNVSPLDLVAEDTAKAKAILARPSRQDLDDEIPF